MKHEKQTVPAVNPASLANVPTSELIGELRRRGCAVAVITPADVIQQWKTNQEADEANEPEPTDEETFAALRLIQRYLEKTVFENEPAFEWGPASDACELISAWRKEGKNK